MFSSLYGTYHSFKMHFKMSSAICFNLDQSKIMSSGHGLKVSGKRRKKLITRIFSFYHYVFSPFKEQISFLFHIHCVVAIVFNLGKYFHFFVYPFKKNKKKISIFESHLLCGLQMISIWACEE